VQLGENWQGTFDVDAAVRAGACRLVTFDAARIGGVTGWRRCLPATAGRPVSSHAYPEISAHLLAVRDGFARATDRPGSGVAWDEQAVARALR
jgi:mandelate racemase